MRFADALRSVEESLRATTEFAKVKVGEPKPAEINKDFSLVEVVYDDRSNVLGLTLGFKITPDTDISDDDYQLLHTGIIDAIRSMRGGITIPAEKQAEANRKGFAVPYEHKPGVVLTVWPNTDSTNIVQ